MQRLQASTKQQFSKGLITEAGPLTFPEGATTDELNMDLVRDGSRRRRLGVQLETGHVSQSLSYNPDAVSGNYVWDNVGAQSDLSFAVVQVDHILHFFEISSSPLSASKKSFNVNLTTHSKPTSNGAGESSIQVTSIKGVLVVASPALDTFFIEYDKDTDTVSTTEIEFRFRDFEWLGDRSTYSTSVSVASVSKERIYDNRNCGWFGNPGGTAMSRYAADTGDYPPLTLPWYAGKNASGSFATDEWNKTHAGTSLIGNGTYILDLYLQNRATIASVPGLPSYTENTRFETVAAFAGRVFYAGMSSQKNTNNIYFSQILEDLSTLGECLQRLDPTAEGLSDLLATDGGVINIPQAYKITKLHVIGPNLLVFADNGVWQITGVEGGFKATDYAVSRISEVGLTYPNSFVSAEGRPYWWAGTGIYTLRSSPEQQALSAVNISLDTVQTLYEGIAAKEQCRVAYDGFSSRVLWIYPASGESITGKLRRILVFDETTSSFVPWELADSDTYLLDALFIRGTEPFTKEFEVVDNAGTLVFDRSGNQVVRVSTSRTHFSSSVKFLTVTDTGGITFSGLTGAGFLDWETEDYSSFLDTGYDFMGDLTLRKNIIYCTTYFEQTERNLVATAEGGLEFDRPSSCTLQAQWDFARTPPQAGQQAYRLKRLPASVNPGPLDYPESTVQTRLRIRGKGRQVQLKFNSEQGKDMHLYGFEMITGVDPKP